MKLQGFDLRNSKNKWFKCYSDFYNIFKNLTLKEMMLVFEEIKKKNQIIGRSHPITSAKIAQFLRSAEAEEFLMSQRLKDHELKRIFTHDSIENYQNEMKELTENTKTITLEDNKMLTTERQKFKNYGSI
jgi:putative transposase